MTRKDYEIIADAFKRAFDRAPQDTRYLAGIEQALFEVTLKLEADNPRFHAETFQRAIRPELFIK